MQSTKYTASPGVQDRARHVRQEILDIVRAYGQGGLTAADARAAIDTVIDTEIDEAVTDALREIEGSD
jgi:hypothetical protein